MPKESSDSRDPAGITIRDADVPGKEPAASDAPRDRDRGHDNPKILEGTAGYKYDSVCHS